MRTKRIIKIFLIIVIILAVFVLSCYMIWSIYQLPAMDNIGFDRSAIQNKESRFKALKLGIFSTLNELKQYGQWPLSAVPLSEGRGNPFEAQE